MARQTVRAVPGDDLFAALSEVVRTLVPAVSVETASVWLRARDEAGDLHLVALEGFRASERTQFAVEPMPLATSRTVLVLGARHSIPRALGLRWLDGEWLAHEEEILGVLVVGSRTRRRPTDDDRSFLAATADELAVRLAEVDRRDRRLRALSARLVRAPAVEVAEDEPSGLDALRPRERTVLELYADGLGARQIADLLVISPHTVRTHVKHAFRRLGVHSREEAAELVQAARVARLL